MKYEVLVDGHLHEVELERAENGYQCKVDHELFDLNVVMTARDVLSIVHQGRQYEAKREYSLQRETHIIVGSERFGTEVRDPRSLRSRTVTTAAAGPAKITAPMPGRIVRVIAAEGDDVEIGQGLVVVEAMKMQNEIKSTKKGKVTNLAVQEGVAVNAGDLLAVVE
ncbi:MAG: acetyl-CoA carboxylase biotin carboxyl carrier protein subunit [Acidobacteria bacterium]|nr:MAG: acetyl-CoA carboxylase biotin carboxyl carrier protein subunit [Acidobacteriota bacterium]